MTEERIVETRTPSGDTHTHTTVITDDRPSSGGGGKVFLGIVILLLAVVAIWAFTQFGSAEVAKDNAVADAASSVGNAADQVGNAAQDAADNIGE